MIELGTLVMDSSPEARSVREETFTGETEMRDIALEDAISVVVGSKPLAPDIRELDGDRLLDENFETIWCLKSLSCCLNEDRSPS